MNVSEEKKRNPHRLNLYRITLLVLLAVCCSIIIVKVVLWTHTRAIILPEGTIYEVTFRFNPRRHVLNREISADRAKELPDREFSISVSSWLLREKFAAEDAKYLIDNKSSISVSRSLSFLTCEDLFDKVSIAENAYRVRWEYPCCEIYTRTNGPFILRLQQRAVEDILIRSDEYKKGEIYFYYDRAGGHPSPRICSDTLSRAIVEAVRSDKEIMEQLQKVAEMLKEK